MMLFLKELFTLTLLIVMLTAWVFFLDAMINEPPKPLSSYEGKQPPASDEPLTKYEMRMRNLKNENQ